MAAYHFEFLLLCEKKSVWESLGAIKMDLYAYLPQAIREYSRRYNPQYHPNETQAAISKIKLLNLIIYFNWLLSNYMGSMSNSPNYLGSNHMQSKDKLET